MEDNVFEKQYNVTKKNRILRFYETYKIFIFSFFVIIVILIGSLAYSLSLAEKKKILVSEKYISAKINIENDNKNNALKELKKIIFTNDSTYSTLSFFLIIDQNLTSDYKEISDLYNHLLENNTFEKSALNLLIY